MTIALARMPVAAPSFTPLSFGLLSAVQTPPEGDQHWEAGVEYMPDGCAEASATTDPCPETESITKSPNVTGIDVRGATPFTVYAELFCSPVGLWDEYEARTTALLTNGEARAVERVFWTGNAAGVTVYPHLAEDTAVDSGSVSLQTAATVVSGSVMTPVAAIAQLEGALAECYGGEGVIHVPRAALAYLHASGVLIRDGQRLRTLGGNIVAAYASNNLEGPTGTAVGISEAWFYATGAVSMRRSAIRMVPAALVQALNRSENAMVFIAERTYLLNWDCCHFAQRVSLSLSGGYISLE